MEMELMAEFLEEFQEHLVVYYECWIMHNLTTVGDASEFVTYALKKSEDDKLGKRGPAEVSYEDVRRFKT